MSGQRLMAAAWFPSTGRVFHLPLSFWERTQARGEIMDIIINSRLTLDQAQEAWRLAGCPGSKPEEAAKVLINEASLAEMLDAAGVPRPN